MSNPTDAGVSPSDLAVVFDPLACASCGEPYTAQAPCTPCTMPSCGHSVCAACWRAISVVPNVKCVICQKIIGGVPVENTVLGELCDVLRRAESTAGRLGDVFCIGFRFYRVL